MNELQSIIQSMYEDVGFKLIRAPYDYAMEESLNENSDAHCSICGRQLSINEWTHQNKEREQVCKECYDNHVFPIHFSNVHWFLDLNRVMDFDNPNNDERWALDQPSNPLYFTQWLNNLPNLRNEFFFFTDKIDDKKRPIIKAVYLPQFVEIQAASRILHSMGAYIDDCSFQYLDTFPNFQGKYEDIIVIYNKQDMEHFDKEGKPLDMQVNPMSDIFGKEIKGPILLIHASLITSETFYFYTWRSCLDFSEVENYDRYLHSLYL